MSKNPLPFESRYKKFRILSYGKAYTNFKSYNIKHNPHNTTNITTIYVDNQPCNNIPRTKDNDDSEGEKQPLLGKKEKKETRESRESREAKDTNERKVSKPIDIITDTKPYNYKYFVEIHYDENLKKPILEYIMTQMEINELLIKYGYVMGM